MNSMLSDTSPLGANPRPLSGVERLVSYMFGKLETGCLRLRFPSGAVREFRGKNPTGNSRLDGDMRINSWSLIGRLLRRGGIGLGEGYMAGDWDSPNLARLLSLFAANREMLESRLRPGVGFRLLTRLGHALNRNSRAGAKRNIAHHYDLGNDFYALWLDRGMTYSSALFEREGEELHRAQARKYRALARAVGIREGDRVLEIGCGWGGFAEFAIRAYGCHVTGITLSREQLDYARKRLCDKGLSEHAELRLVDYRDVRGSFDRVISIEMLEAVGAAYWSRYFGKIRSLLKEGGRAGIQAITVADQRFECDRAEVGFIQKYIFPGGMLPCDRVLKQHIAAAGLRVRSQLSFGSSYARTLAAWANNFRAGLPGIRGLGFDQRFIRMWLFYLAYCKAGFRQGILDVTQYVVK